MENRDKVKAAGGATEQGSGPDPKVAELEQEKQAKAMRENQQILLYIFVSAVIATSWILGYMEFSFLWSFILIVFTFLVWWSKVITLSEEHLKYHEMILHRKRALRDSETTEWLNFIINRWWVFSSSSIQDLIKRNLDPILSQVRPAFIENIEVSTFSLGETTPFIKYMKVYECGEWRTGGRKALSWLSFGQPPPGLAQSQQYQIVLEADVALHCDEFKMVFTTRLGGKWMGMNLDVAVEKLNISGKMQLILHLNMDTPFPHISTVTVSFQEKPEVWFAIRLLKAVQMMEIPLLKSWIHSLVMDGLTEALVDPGKIDIRTESAGPTYAPARSKAKSKAQGVLTVTVGSEQSRGSDAGFLFTEDLRYCVLRLGDTDQKQTIGQTQGPGAWQDSCSFLIDNLSKDKLIIKSKSKRLLSTYTLAQFDLSLGDYPLLIKPIVETSVEEKVSKWAVSGSVKLDLALEYTILPSIEEELDREVEKPSMPLEGQVAGVMYVCVHSANNLLALDRTGTSDPYCIIFSNGKKLKTTHYVCRTRNPKWDVHVEFIVGDFTKTMLSFLVYDWDGRHASEDDFLGSAYMVLSEDEPRTIRKSLTLGYNLLNVGQVDNMKLGTIEVTAIFRPIASVSKSGTLHTQEMSSVAQNVSYQEHQAVNRNKNFMTSAKLKFTGAKDQKGVGDLLSMGHGILELNILRARDLVPMDSNGFSDPFCEVRIGSERKFTTSIKKKTLNPVWDEWVTMQLPKPCETLEIIVWDRDPFFKKDFLGLVTFSLEDLKLKSSKPNVVSRNSFNEFGDKDRNAAWFPLQRIRSGSIQLHFKVISEEASNLSPEEFEGVSPTSPSDSVDGGVPRSVSETPLVDSNRPLTPRLPTSRSAPAPQTTQMSPILETSSRSKPDVTQHCALLEPSLSQTTDEEPSTGVGHLSAPKALLSCVGLLSLACPVQPPQEGAATSVDSLSSRPKPRSTSPKRRRRRSLSGSRLLRRATSEANIKKSNSASNVFKTVSQGSTPTNSKGTLRRMDSVSSWGESVENNELSGSPGNGSTEKYYHVTGQVLSARGLGTLAKSIYCKVRLDTRSASARSQKHSYGRVLSRSNSIDVSAETDTQMNLNFDVDKGRGVEKDAILVFDVKTSTKDHAGTKGFSLYELITDKPSIRQWVDIGSGIDLDVQLHSKMEQDTNLTPKAGLLQIMRSSTRRKTKTH